MTIFIELTTDAFDDQFTRRVNGSSTYQSQKVDVRRPLRGLEIKDETYAYIKLIRADGQEIRLVDSGSETGDTAEYSNFMLQSVTEIRMERHQIVETFGDTYIYLFGESPRFLQVSAVLLNSFDFNWHAEFQENYDKYLRGTRAIERGARTYLFYDSNVVEGYILNCQTTQSATPSTMEIPLSFQFFVTNSYNVSMLGDTRFPVRASAIIPGGLDPTNPEDTYFFEFFSGNTANNAEDNVTGRSLPIRSAIYDNKDEYLGPNSPNVNVDSLLLGDEVQDLNASLGDGLSAYGVDDDYAYGPTVADSLGLAPTFYPTGVGVGAGARAGVGATFGARAVANVTVGGFVGAKVSAKASLGFMASAGVSASASAGAFVGARATTSARLGAGAFVRSEEELVVGGNALAGAGVVAYPSTSQSYKVATWEKVTSRRNGPVTALAVAKASVVTATGSSFAQENTRQAALAGGYAKSNAYLGFRKNQGNPADSCAGNSGAGAAVSVGGRITAFSFASAPGTLQNTTTPPAALLAESKHTPGYVTEEEFE